MFKGEKMENFRLKVFRAVCASLNFSRAAEELLLPSCGDAADQSPGRRVWRPFSTGAGPHYADSGGQALLPYAAEKLKVLSEEAFVGSGQRFGGEMRASWRSELRRRLDNNLLPNLVAGFFEKIRA